MPFLYLSPQYQNLFNFIFTSLDCAEMLPASDISFFLNIVKFNAETSIPNCFAVATQKAVGFHSSLWITEFFFDWKHFAFYSSFITGHSYTLIKNATARESLALVEDTRYNLCMCWIMSLSHTCNTCTFKCDWWWKSNWNWVYDDRVILYLFTWCTLNHG